VSAGTPLVPVHEPMKPNVVLALAPSAPLYAAFRAVTAVPLVVTVAFHAWLRLWPFANVHVTVQPLIGAEPAATRTSAWKPPVHWLVTE
jgi:hypothetical protein